MKLEKLDIDKLVEDHRNARRHPEQNLAAIRASLAEFGQVEPLVVRADTLEVIGGNGRLTVMRELGWQSVEVTLVELDDIASAKLSLALNRTGDLADWDAGALSALIAEIATTEDGVASLEPLHLDELPGIDVDGILNGPASAEHVESTEPIEVVGEPDSQAGEVYQLGSHRLMCGDCRNADDVATLFGDDVADLAFTSPPYASQRKYDETTEFKPIPEAEYLDWFELVQALVRKHLSDKGSWVVNIKEHTEEGQRVLYVKDLTIAHARQWGWRFVDELIWHNRTPMPGRFTGRFKNAFEPLFHFSMSGDFFWDARPVSAPSDMIRDYKADGKRQQNNYESLPESRKSGIAAPGNVLHMSMSPSVVPSVKHPAMMSVQIPEFFVKAYCPPKGLVFDPFMGSGTTLIAAQTCGARSLGMEISPKYCDIIRKRWTRLADEQKIDAGAGALRDGES